MAQGPLAQGMEIPVIVRLGEPQLFVDDWLIATASDLKRTLHQPVKDHRGEIPILTLPAPQTLLAKGTIVYDPKLNRFVMFAKSWPDTNIYRFTSVDGIDWRHDSASAVPESIVFDRRHPESGRIEGYLGMTCFHYDRLDPTHPYKGWICFGNWGNEHEAVYYLRSPDGKQWDRVGKVVEVYAGPGDTSCREIHQDGRVVWGPGDTTRFGYDPTDNRFLGIFKFFTTGRIPPGNNLRSRAYAFVDRLDKPFDITRLNRVDLLPPAAARNGDRPYDEYYATTAWKYGSMWLGELLVWHRGEDYPYSAAGCAFAKLVVSRDGLHWHKVGFPNDSGFTEVFIPNGPEGGNKGQNDGGYMSFFSQGPLRIGDELVYYYGCTSYGKNHPKTVRKQGGGIFRARLRLDGFVSVDQGTLTTPPIAFDGQDMLLNGVGPIRVEVLDTQEQVVGDTTIMGDSIQHQVRFAGKRLWELVPDGIVRLRLTVSKGGALYSLTLQ